MVKKINFLVALMLVMLCSTAWAQTETYSHTFASKEITTDAGSKSLDNVEWTWTASTYCNFVSGKGVQIGSSKKPQSTWTISTDSIHGTITSIKVKASTANDGVAMLTIKVGDENYKCGNATNASLTTTPTEYEFTGFENGAIAITMQATKKAMYLASITVTYSTSIKTATTLTFAEGDKTFDVGGGQRHGKLYQCSHSFTCSGGCFHRL